LREWPLRQTVKCLVLYHPDDEEDPRARQERQLLRLFDACRKTRRELLLEIITPRGMAADASTVARAMSRIYDLGVRPDWWKLEPNADPAAWRAVAATLEARDPLCRGVVLLGQSAHAEVLVAAFKAAAAFDMIKGFAVGRTLFAEPARAWLTGAIDDAEAIDALANNFAALVEAWRSAKAAARARTAAE
jgi:5-dehydro-2-deoxygluconokinase